LRHAGIFCIEAEGAKPYVAKAYVAKAYVA
jgi:hypothetical protein